MTERPPTGETIHPPIAPYRVTGIDHIYIAFRSRSRQSFYSAAGCGAGLRKNSRDRTEIRTFITQPYFAMFFVPHAAGAHDSYAADCTTFCFSVESAGMSSPLPGNAPRRRASSILGQLLRQYAPDSVHVLVDSRLPAP